MNMGKINIKFKKRTMKKIVVLFMSMILVMGANAQVNTNLIVNPTPPATLTEWAYHRENLVYQVQAGAGLQVSYKIKTEIKLMDGTVIGKNDLAKALTYTLGSANIIYTATEVLQLENMLFTGKYKTTLERTGKLISDNYQICVRLVRPTDFTPVSEEKCKNFYLASLQLPVLMKPAAEEELDYKMAKNIITFRWTPVVPMQKSPVTYRLMVFEVLQNQNPVQAMRSNMPILNTDLKARTQYQWQPQGILGFDSNIGDSLQVHKAGISTSRSNIPRDGNKTKAPGNDQPYAKRFVWTIQAFDINGQPMGDGNINGDGVSEPVMFYVKDKTHHAEN
jgi:hypothetical protein